MYSGVFWGRNHEGVWGFSEILIILRTVIQNVNSNTSDINASPWKKTKGYPKQKLRGSTSPDRLGEDAMGIHAVAD